VSVSAVAVAERDTAARAAVAASYVLLIALYLWSRLYGLGRGGFCCDEIETMAEYVREGPATILTGTYAPNNHQLFSMYGWATSVLFGESEVVMRLGSVIPFLAGTALVSTWLHRRVSALSGILFLFLATVSPLLLDLSRMARGYGIAFLAMAALVVAALEATRSERTWPIVAVCAAGVVGSLTLPHFAVAYGSIVVVLLAAGIKRGSLALGFGASIAVIVAWWAPHVDDVLASTTQDYGRRISTAWLATAPIDQILIPALTLIDETVLHAGPPSVAIGLLFAVVASASPLLRSRVPALVLSAGIVTTVLAFWASDTKVAPRFFSFLLIPMYLGAATGAAAVLERVPVRPWRIRGIAALTFLAVAAAASAPRVSTIPFLPREAIREAAQATRSDAHAGARVTTYVPHGVEYEFYLGDRVDVIWTRRELREVCARRRATVLVVAPWYLGSSDVPCSRRPGARRVHFEQYARGGSTDVWFLPPLST
jgi:hypothetical protein